MAIQKVSGPSNPYSSAVSNQNNKPERKPEAVSLGQLGPRPLHPRNHAEVVRPEVYTKDKIRNPEVKPREPIGRLPGAGNPNILPVDAPVEKVGPPPSFQAPTPEADLPIGPSPAVSVGELVVGGGGSGKGGLKVDE